MEKPIEDYSVPEMIERLEGALRTHGKNSTVPIAPATIRRILTMLNSSLHHRQGASGHTGVTYRKDRGLYEAYFRSDGRKITLYRGTDKAQAIAARTCWEIRQRTTKEQDHATV